jgi:hypothetical protein
MKKFDPILVHLKKYQKTPEIRLHIHFTASP